MGGSKFITNQNTQSFTNFMGKAKYMAPELLEFTKGRDYTKSNWFRADLYSLSKVVLEAGVLKFLDNDSQ